MKPEITYEIICEEEDIPFTGNCSAVDEETDRKTEEWIASELERGNQWAWCYVRVVARCGRFSGSAGYGGCSYKSERDFLSDSASLDDLREVARENLLAHLRELAHPTPDKEAADLLKHLGEEP